MVQKMHILNFNVIISINIHHHDFRLSCHARKVFLSTRPSQILIYVFNINMSLFYLFKSLINQEFILLKGKRQQSVLVLFSKWLAVYLFPTALEDACLLCVDFSHIWDLLLDPLSCRTVRLSILHQCSSIQSLRLYHALPRGGTRTPNYSSLCRVFLTILNFTTKNF